MTTACRPGLVVFNTTTQQWSNVTADGYSPTDKVWAGVAHFVPMFAADGVLLAMSGMIDAESDLASVRLPSYALWESPQFWTTSYIAPDGSCPSPLTSSCVVVRHCLDLRSCDRAMGKPDRQRRHPEPVQPALRCRRRWRQRHL